jgi:hypothetical protein
MDISKFKTIEQTDELLAIKKYDVSLKSNFRAKLDFVCLDGNLRSMLASTTQLRCMLTQPLDLNGTNL